MASTVFEDELLLIPPLDSLTWLQGSSQDILAAKSSGASVSLCLLIQPNCPGCHENALPLLNELYNGLRQQRGSTSSPTSAVDSIYVVSTAFEDFEYNTIDSAKKLVEQQELVGIAKSTLGSSSSKYYKRLAMPFAHDSVVPAMQATPDLKATALQAIRFKVQDELRLRNPYVSRAQLNLFLEQVNESMLPQQLARYFWQVRAGGTPTWVLHGTATGQVLARRIGPFPSSQALRAWIKDAVHQSEES